MPHLMALRGEPADAPPIPRQHIFDPLSAGRARAGRTGAAGRECRSFAPGAELFAQDQINEDVFTLVEGWAALHHILEDGRRQILQFLLPGDICGFVSPPGGPAPHAAEALTEVTATVLPQSQFVSMLAADARHAASVIGRLSGSIVAAHDSLVDIGRRNALEAVAHLLFRLDRRIREAGGASPGATVDFPPTQEQLGDALGLSAAHVCRTLRVLRERGILSLDRHGLRIHDPGALNRMLGQDERGVSGSRQTGGERCR